MWYMKDFLRLIPASRNVPAPRDDTLAPPKAPVVLSPSPLVAWRRLTYWVVFAAFSILEAFLSVLLLKIPFYFALKLAFLAWCFLPQTQVCVCVWCQRERDKEIVRVDETGE